MNDKWVIIIMYSVALLLMLAQFLTALLEGWGGFVSHITDDPSVSRNQSRSFMLTGLTVNDFQDMLLKGKLVSVCVGGQSSKTWRPLVMKNSRVF